MIADSDRMFLANLNKAAQKEARAFARSEAALNAPLSPKDEAENAPDQENLESEEEVDEITQMIHTEELQNKERQE